MGGSFLVGKRPKFNQKITFRLPESAMSGCYFAPEKRTHLSHHPFMKALIRGLVTALAGLFVLFSPAHAQYRGSSSITKTGIAFRGSATVGQELLPALLRAYLLQNDASNLSIAGEHSLSQMFKAAMPDGERYVAQIVSEGTRPGFRSFADGDADVVMASRRIKATDVGENSLLLRPENEFPFCIDAIVLIVNNNNPISALTLEQVRDIYCGRITDWSQLVPNRAGPIHVYCQPPASGTMDFFASVVMKGCTIAAHARPLLDQEQLCREVLADSLAIGFVAQAFATRNKVLALAPSASEPAVFPETATLEQDTYPLSRKLYLYADSTQNILVAKFLQFVLAAPAAREVIVSQGFLPISKI